MSHLTIQSGLSTNSDPLRLNSNSELFLHLLRAVAAQLVVIGHAITMFGVMKFVQPPSFFYIQNLGVAVFFFMSGYVISYTCQVKLSTRNYGFDEFLFDRAIRLYVVLIPSLIFIVACDCFFWKYLGAPYEFENNLTIKAVVSNLFFLQYYPPGWLLGRSFADGWLAQAALGTGRPLWSLAAEWWLYVAYGWLMLSPPESAGRRVGGRLLALASLPVVLYGIFGGHDTGLALLWCLGVGAMHLMRGRTLPDWDSRWLFVVGCSMFLLSFFCPVADKAGHSFRMNVCLCLAVASLLLAHQATRFQFYEYFRLGTVIRFFADYSFTLYLTHYTVEHWARVLYGTRAPQLAVVLGTIVLSNIVAIAIASVTEFRYRSLRNWFATRQLAPATPGSNKKGDPIDVPENRRLSA
jgi:peptidoglycan/LPS O-acetylase OafA/YrhL